MLFFILTFPQLASKPLEHNLIIKKTKMIVLINAFSLIKKFKIQAYISQNPIFCNTKILCHHVEYTLFRMWLQYEII